MKEASAPLQEKFRLRPELEFSIQQHQSKTYHVVKDPLTKRYFRFTEAQAILLNLLREPIELEALAEGASAGLNNPVSVETISRFLDSLSDKYLLDTPEVHSRLANFKGLGLPDSSFLYWKLASLNPEK